MRGLMTRTYEGVNVEALVCNLTNYENNLETIRLITQEKTETKIQKLVEKEFNPTTHRVVTITSITPFKELRGMSIDDFYTNSVLLDENRKPVTDDNASIADSDSIVYEDTDSVPFAEEVTTDDSME